MPDLPPPAGQRARFTYTDSVGLGILYMCGNTFVSALSNAVIKWMAADYSVMEMVFLRSLFALLPVLYFVMREGGFGMLRTPRLAANISRSVCGVMGLTFMFWAVTLMPLADATAITFSSSLFMTALSVPLLKEKVGLHRWSAVAVGFVGVLIVVRPGGDIANWGALIALFGALAGAMVGTFLRDLGRTEPSTRVVFYHMFIATLIAGACMPYDFGVPHLFGWVTPSPGDLALFAIIGVASGVTQFWLTAAYRMAAPSLLAPFQYSTLIWATILGFVVFGDRPTLSLFAGAILIIASGMYIMHRESVRRRNAGRAADVPPPDVPPPDVPPPGPRPGGP